MKIALKIIIFSLAGLATFALKAQWSVGGRAGLNMCMITGQMSTEYHTRNFWIYGPSAYGISSKQVTERFSLRGELGYTIMGNEAIHRFDDGAYEFNYGIVERYRCAQFLFAAQVLFYSKKISLSGIAGNYLTYRFGGNGSYYDERITEDLKIVWTKGYSYRIQNGELLIGSENNSRIDFGLFIGGVIGKKIGQNRLELDCRFGLGMIDLYNFSSDDLRAYAYDNGYKPHYNLNFNFTLAYMFLITGK